MDSYLDLSFSYGGEHVLREIRESGPKNVRVDDTDACENSSGEVAACEHKVVVPGRGHAVDVDHS